MTAKTSCAFWPTVTLFRKGAKAPEQRHDRSFNQPKTDKIQIDFNWQSTHIWVSKHPWQLKRPVLSGRQWPFFRKGAEMLLSVFIQPETDMAQVDFNWQCTHIWVSKHPWQQKYTVLSVRQWSFFGRYQYVATTHLLTWFKLGLIESPRIMWVSK